VSRSDAERVVDALEHLQVLHEHLESGELEDQLVIDAVSLRLASVIEAIHSRDDSLGQRLFGDAWKGIWATRNHIAHGYGYVDEDLIRATVENDLQSFEAVLIREAGQLGIPVALRGSDGS
jgi:uncharacterized protein with HEPN domain